MSAEELARHAVILAGGRGTRFWPRSRTRTPKQLLNIVGRDTMLEQTLARLRPLIPAEHIWTVTNTEQAASVRRQLPAAARRRILAEPAGRNTAAAIALAAFHVRHAARGDALLAVLPADHHIARAERFGDTMRAALDAAQANERMIVVGIPATRPETGFGYIERAEQAFDCRGFPVFPVRRFTEKPALEAAKQYVASGYDWNAGMFFWRASTFLENLRRYLPKTHQVLEALAKHIGKPSYQGKLRALYPRLENISVDYAILEPATREPGEAHVFVLPAADIGWSDIGSWAAVYELSAKNPGANVFAGPGVSIDADGNLLWSPEKFVAAIGIHNLIVVETPDALLICPRDRAQDVGRIVKHLEQRRKGLL